MFNGDASSSAARNVVRSSSISGEMYNIEKSARGSADSVTVTASKKRRSSLGAKMVAIVGLSQWSKSTLQLNQTGELPRTPPQQRCQPPPELSPLLLGEVHAPGCPKQCSSCLCLMRTPKNASYKCPPPGTPVLLQVPKSFANLRWGRCRSLACMGGPGSASPHQ